MRKALLLAAAALLPLAAPGPAGAQPPRTCGEWVYARMAADPGSPSPDIVCSGAPSPTGGCVLLCPKLSKAPISCSDYAHARIAEGTAARMTMHALLPFEIGYIRAKHSDFVTNPAQVYDVLAETARLCNDASYAATPVAKAIDLVVQRIRDNPPPWWFIGVKEPTR